MSFSVPLNLLQWNSRSLMRRINDLKFILMNDDIHIAAICETHLDIASIIRFPNHEIISHDNRHGGGVALIISKIT